MTEIITRCADCGQATDGQCVHCFRRICLDCSEGKHRCPGLGDSTPGRCWDCGTPYRIGDGYGEEQLFCSRACADAFKAGLGA